MAIIRLPINIIIKSAQHSTMSDSKNKDKKEKMHRKIWIFIVICVLLLVTTTHTYALSDAKVSAIQILLDEACQKSGVPGISVAILNEGQVTYISSGYADKEQALVAGADTQYELASLSKAFTAVGILLLEEQGLLHMTDSIQEYLPWLTFMYRGKPVDMSAVTLNHFLHHTSGLTNSKHSTLIPEGDTPDILLKTVELLSGAELSFKPGEQFSYGTMNYDVLGLVMEAVTGQSYEEFMQRQILQPLGLNNTYMFQNDARSTGQLAQGYRASFLVTAPYNAPTYGGNKPAGYIISSVTDMARWMGIHMGMAQDIPEIFKTVIEKTHQADTTVAPLNGMYYAGGWDVSYDKSIIEHTGGNPNFATAVTLYPQEQTGICLLSNGANTNVALVDNIKAILDDNMKQSYIMGSIQIFDIAGIIITVTGALLAVLFVLLGLRRRRGGEQRPLARKTAFGAWVLISATVIGIICLVVSMVFGGGWVWLSYSLFTAIAALTLLLCSVLWFVYYVRRRPKHR